MVKALIVHGGAGAWRLRPGVEKSIEAARTCAKRGWEVLGAGGSALDAVVEAVKCMEDSGYLNAGYGSVLNLLGERELDAGLMTSSGLLGAVAGVKATRNPILLARLVAEKTPHVLLAGEGADRLAVLSGLPPLPPPPQHVVERYREVLKKLVEEEPADSYFKRIRGFVANNRAYYELVKSMAAAFDTVGAVAVDDSGLLASATSTGGVILKLPGRVGDTPIPGAGFYATSNIACSATGIGEYIIRAMPCMRLDLEYSVSSSLEEALARVLEHANRAVGTNTMGFIAVDKKGRVGYAYNTEAMLVAHVVDGEARAYLKPEPRVAVLS